MKEPLSKKAIRCLIDQRKKGHSTSEIAAELDITPRHARRIWGRFRTTGMVPVPHSPGRVKIEIAREKEIGPVRKIKVPQVPKEYDYPDFEVNVCTLENIFAEKLRAIIDRNKIRDYYDAWRMLKDDRMPKPDIALFLKKCKAKDTGYDGIGQFFPSERKKQLKKYRHHNTHNQ